MANSCPHGSIILKNCKACKKWERAQRRAKDKGIPFSIATSDIIIPEKCPILGLPLDYRTTEHVPNLDQIIIGKGYVPGNVAVISARANRIKNDATLEELELIVEWLRKYRRPDTDYEI